MDLDNILYSYDKDLYKTFNNTEIDTICNTNMNCSIINNHNLFNIFDTNMVKTSLTLKHYIKCGEKCPICFDPIIKCNDSYLTECGHAFHKNVFQITFKLLK